MVWVRKKKNSKGPHQYPLTLAGGGEEKYRKKTELSAESGSLFSLLAPHRLLGSARGEKTKARDPRMGGDEEFCIQSQRAKQKKGKMT